MAQTKLAPGVPFPGLEKAPPVVKPAKKTTAQNKKVDIDSIIRCSDPYVVPDRGVSDKYEALFRDLKAGDCWRCKDKREMGAVSNRLRRKIKSAGDFGVVRTNDKCEDGIPRVWLTEYRVGGAK